MSHTTQISNTPVSFGPFDLDLDRKVLSIAGTPVLLALKPRQVLCHLVVRGGAVVTRNELRLAVWGPGPILGFDDRLNTCVASIRLALGDEAENPRFIQTIRGTGYRFMAPVHCSGREQSSKRSRNRWRSLSMALVLGGLMIGSLWVAFPTRSVPPPQVGGSSIDPLSPQTTTDPLAWSHYLQAKVLLRNMREADVRQAIALLEEAVEQDPSFALGQARLSIARSTAAFFYGDQEAHQAAPSAAFAAIRSAPNRAEPWLALGLVRYYGSRDYSQALEALRRAERLTPDNPEVISVIGWILRRQGRWEEALAYLQRASSLDPHSLELRRSLGATYAAMRDYEAAERHLRLAVAMAPDRPELYLDLAELMLHRGRGSGEALRVVSTGAQRSGIPAEQLVLGSPLLARILGAKLPASPPTPPSPIRRDLGDAGRTSLAAAWLQVRHGDRAGASRTLANLRQSLLRRRRQGPRLSEETATLAQAAAILGLREEVLREAATVQTRLSPRWDAMQGAFLSRGIAEALVTAGEYDRALALLTQLMAHPAPVSPGLLRVDPIWDPIRTDPRFQKMTGAS